MKRRDALRSLLALPFFFPVLGALSACAPLISPRAHDPSYGQPWLCAHCGHLTRSSEDISGQRCPRCGRRQMQQMSEEEMARRLS